MIADINTRDNLVLQYEPTGKNGTARITVELAGEVIAVDTVNLSRMKSRTSFLENLVKDRHGLDRNALDAGLLSIAAELAARNEIASENEAEEEDIDPAAVFRPSLFHAPELSAAAIPRLVRRRTDDGEKLFGTWCLYIQHLDGRRERTPLTSPIKTTGRKLWLHPEPIPPDAHTWVGWSRGARKRWLAGNAIPDPVRVFDKVYSAADDFIHFPKQEAAGNLAALSLWILFTYTFDAWQAVPYLYFGGPAGSGKSRCFDVLGRSVFRPLLSSNMSAPTLYRSLHDKGGTLILDEAEQLRRSADPGISDLNSVLLAGYRRGGQASRLEKVGDTFRPVAFEVFGPKALACITGLPAALASRCICFTMFRAPVSSTKPKRRIDEDPERWQSLRDDLYSLSLAYGPTWLELAKQDDVCPEMSGRNRELWQPLFALASWIEACGATGLVGLLREHALGAIESAKEETIPDHDEILLRRLTEMVANQECPTSKEVLQSAVEEEPQGFNKWTARAVANHLRRYGVTTTKTNGRRVFRPSLVQLKEIQETYGIDLNL